MTDTMNPVLIGLQTGGLACGQSRPRPMRLPSTDIELCGSGTATFSRSSWSASSARIRDVTGSPEAVFVLRGDEYLDLSSASKPSGAEH
jgi:hypothetical protein